uniref:Elongation of fatty acids protein n=1 Tax=Entomoneis paludosa TaxID=265537 RepID=A0A7S2V7P8_9STRA|mmetsp:Transcript_11184/g.22896  ORF Transcript_11184/g.22896 Transcript_11184/m.22896 type:complete len:284 (+) Transcript_11184:46-897(+)
MFEIWRPALSESIDGKPLATSISHLFWEFPYDRLPENSTSLNIFLRPEGMLVMLIFYLNSKPLFQTLYESVKPTKGKAWFTASVALHNLALALFSAIVAYNSWPIVAGHWMDRGFMDTYCDNNGVLWQESGFGAWVVIFYLSKYYEFVDSWVLVLKGKKPSFLQVYHHTGICFCMWAGTLSQGSWLIYVVLFNSVIHTLMYTYFFIKTINPQAEIKAAKYLTTAQIGQFFTGIGCSCSILFMGDSCNSSSSRFGLACLNTYGIGLIALFMSFAKKKYSSKKTA